MMHPMLPPKDHYELYRAFRDGASSQRRGRHLSSPDLHELGGDHDAPRPYPVWMALRRAGERIGRLAPIQRFQEWREERAIREIAPSPPPAAEEPCVRGNAIPVSGRALTRG